MYRSRFGDSDVEAEWTDMAALKSKTTMRMRSLGHWYAGSIAVARGGPNKKQHADRKT